MRPFLVCYNYGMGGIWLYVDAENAAELRRSYPNSSLVLFPEPPPFWTDELEKYARGCRPEDEPYKSILEDMKKPD
jgi:hypothetical protein